MNEISTRVYTDTKVFKYHKQGRTEDFVIQGAERYSIVAIWAHPSRQRRDFLGGPGACPPGKFLQLTFSEIQSSAFWTLKVIKCLDFILNK